LSSQQLCCFCEVLLTGTKDYGKSQKGIEFPGDRIKDYDFHRYVRTNGYNYVDKMFDQEELQNDDFSNQYFLFDERNDYRLFKTKDEVDNLHHFRTPQLQLRAGGHDYNWILSPSYKVFFPPVFFRKN
jgi:hypothetical protein